MKVNGVPQWEQKERNRPAQRNSFGRPAVNRKSLRRNDAHVTNGAPLLRRQSEQWQWEMS